MQFRPVDERRNLEYYALDCIFHVEPTTLDLFIPLDAKGLLLAQYIYSFYFEDPLTHTRLSGVLFKIANGTYTKKELKKCLPAWGPTVDGMLMFPFNPGSCHWALTVVHWKLGSIQHFDFLNRTPVESLKENPMVSQVQSLMKKSFPERSFDFDESDPNLPQQRDSYSCGVSCKAFVVALTICQRQFFFFTTLRSGLSELSCLWFTETGLFLRV